MNDHIEAAEISIGCRQDAEAEAVTSDARNLSPQDASCTPNMTRTDYDSGDVGGTHPHKVRTNNVQIPTQSAPCPTCGGSCMVFLGGLLRCPTCHGTGVAK